LLKHKLNIIDGSTYPETDPATNVTEALNNLNSYVNAGWTVAAAGNGYEKHVSIGHTVNFVGLGNVDVDGVDEENGVRTINISSDSPIDYATTKAEVDGKEVDVVKANDGKWYPKDKVDEDNNPKEGAVSIPSSDIVKKGAKLTDSDTENNPYEKGNAYTYDKDGNITATGYDKTKPESKDEITAGKNGVQLNNVGWATQPDQAVNKDQLDQTVNKSGFFVKNNGNDVATKDSTDKEISPKDKVTPNDAINFANGDGTVVNVKTVRDENGVDTTTVSVDVDAAKVIEKTKGSIKVAETDPKSANAGKVTVTPVQKPDGSMETQDEANAREGNKVATVQNVVNAINSAATFVKVADSQEVIEASTANDKGVAVKSGDTVTHTAGKNLKVKRDGQSVTYALAQDIDVDSVKAKNGVTIGSGDNATTITSDDKGLNLAGKNGAATNINNVKDADLNSTSKQAVNGSQLYTTNVQVNKNSQNINRIESKVDSLSRVINNHADELNRLDRKVNKQGKEARAGIAGANAARKPKRARPAYRLPRPGLLGRARRVAQNPCRKRLHPMQPCATRMQQPLPQRCPQPQQQLHPCVHPMRHGGRTKPKPRMASPAPSRRTNRLRAQRRTRCAHRRMRQMPRVRACAVPNPFSGCLNGAATARRQQA